MPDRISPDEPDGRVELLDSEGGHFEPRVYLEYLLPEEEGLTDVRLPYCGVVERHSAEAFARNPVMRWRTLHDANVWDVASAECLSCNARQWDDGSCQLNETQCIATKYSRAYGRQSANQDFVGALSEWVLPGGAFPQSAHWNAAGLCSRCGSNDDIEEVTSSSNRSVCMCSSCRWDSVIECDVCGDTFINPDLVVFSYSDARRASENEDLRVCHNCAATVRVCDECGSVLSRSDQRETEGGEMYCPSCYDEHSEETVIRRYHSTCKTRRFFTHSPTGKIRGKAEILLGFENEVECDPDISLKEMNKLAWEFMSMLPDGLVFAEADSSISYGWEIITAPMSPQYLQDVWPQWEKALRFLAKSGCRSHDTETCGLHIHVGLPAFGACQTEQDATIAKVLLVVERFWCDFVRISRRSHSSMDRWAASYRVDTPVGVDTLVRQKHSLSRTRAVNLTNSDTIEFRFFRGSLNPDTIIGSIGVILALVEYAKSKNMTQVHNAKNLRKILNPYASDAAKAYLDRRLITCIDETPEGDDD